MQPNFLFSKKANCFLVLLFFVITITFAQETIPVKDIKPGMIGYGLSVFRGNRIERFHVQVIDILKNYFPGEDIILVRCNRVYGGYDIEKSGVIRGMSGSPVFFKGKLAGAISLGWTFSKEPIAGVTPISNMLDIVKRPLEKKIAIRNRRSLRSVGGLMPLKSPLMVSGVTRRTFGEIQKQFSSYNWYPVYGAGSRSQGTGTGEYKIVPGAAIGAQLMSGDLDLTSIGTVTWVNKDKVLAFGHSFFNAGELNVPITTAHIITVMKSSMISFKMGQPVRVVGMLMQDRQAGIYGKLGKTCPMIPVDIYIRNKVNQVNHKYKIRIMRHPSLSPRLCAIATFNFIDVQEAAWGEQSLFIEHQIYIRNHPKPFVWKNLYSGTNISARLLLGPLMEVFKNPFRKLDIEKIVVKVDMDHFLRKALILSLKSNKTHVNPGESLELYILVLPFQKPKELIPFSFRIPKHLKPGEYMIQVAGGSNVKVTPISPVNLKEYFKALKKLNKYQNNQILVALALPSFKVYCEGEELEDLPVSVVGNLLPTNSTRDIQLIPKVYIKKKNMPYMMSGTAAIYIQVVKKD